MSLYAAVADLPVTIEGHDLRLHERETSSGFVRKSTEIALHGGGHVGRGEDVTYDPDEQEAFVAGAVDLPLGGEHTVASASAALDDHKLFPKPPEREAFLHYRRWGVESAVLDLALRQADTNLGGILDRKYAPVRFVVSTGLGEPPTADPVHRLLDLEPTLEFKLDATPGWTPELAEELAATGRVRTIDLKGQYGEDVPVETAADPALYRLVVEAFPEALLEDPELTSDTRPVLEPVAERVTWDAPIESLDDIRGLPWKPRWLNCKPSRFGTVEAVLGVIEHCEGEGIDLYGGGQFELSVGRGQIQALASLFYADAPNDVAPGGYNDPEPSDSLPPSPLAPPDDPVSFGW